MDKIFNSLSNRVICINILIIFIIVGIRENCKAQNNTRIDTVLVNESFQQRDMNFIISTLSKNYNSKIYVKTERLNNILHDFYLENIPLPKVLSQISEKINFDFIVYHKNVYFLIPKIISNDTDDILRNEIDKAELFNATENNVIKLKGTNEGKSKNTIKGKVLDKTSEDYIVGATILLNGVPAATSNDSGDFELEGYSGKISVSLQYLGYSDYTQWIDVEGNVQFNILLEKESELLEEVLISSVAADSRIQETQIGISRIDVKTLEQMPLFLGERDVVKAVLLNPGVSTIGEGAIGYNVRGGSVDQNLMLQDDAILFNSSHALGFFSTYNTDIIKSATLAKSNMAASYGGRLASVLDVKTAEDVDRLKYKLNLNPISTSGYLETKLTEKSSLIAAGRTTFSNLLFNLLSLKELKNSAVSFYDLNLKYILKSNKDIYTVSGYYSDDLFNYNQQFGFEYSTKIIQGSWKRILNPKNSNQFNAVWSEYDSKQNDYVGQSASIFSTKISYIKLSDKFVTIWKGVNLQFGLNSIYYYTNPGAFEPLGQESTKVKESLEQERALESAVYFNSEFKAADWLEFAIGARVNHFVFLGPKSVYNYIDGIPNEKNITDVVLKEGMIKTYQNIEPRLSAKINLSSTSSLKLGFAKTSQFINQIFNTDTPTPSSQWQLSNTYIQPGESQNYSIGLFKNMRNNNLEFSLEAYYRNILKAYDYKDFANLFVNHHIETELLGGIGRSQGIEFSAKKNNGKINGFISYTYSQALLKIEGINNGIWYRSNFDKPHNFSMILNFQPIEKQIFTANFTYSTGRPSTAPISNYLTPDNVYVPIYSDRNQIRIPDTHRLDLSANFGRTHNKAAKVKTSWTFTIYNVYARRNPFSLFYTRGFNNLPQTNRLAVVGTVLPSISFNIEFL